MADESARSRRAVQHTHAQRGEAARVRMRVRMRLFVRALIAFVRVKMAVVKVAVRVLFGGATRCDLEQSPHAQTDQNQSDETI